MAALFFDMPQPTVEDRLRHNLAATQGQHARGLELRVERSRKAHIRATQLRRVLRPLIEHLGACVRIMVRPSVLALRLPLAPHSPAQNRASCIRLTLYPAI
eukprot:6214514-Pleurochrysis_carterae.AAC.5